MDLLLDSRLFEDVTDNLVTVALRLRRSLDTYGIQGSQPVRLPIDAQKEVRIKVDSLLNVLFMLDIQKPTDPVSADSRNLGEKDGVGFG